MESGKPPGANAPRLAGMRNHETCRMDENAGTVECRARSDLDRVNAPRTGLASPLLTSDLSGERHISWQRALERFGERLQDCQNHVQQAERQAQLSESALAEQEADLRRFRTAITEMRQKLAAVPAFALE